MSRSKGRGWWCLCWKEDNIAGSVIGFDLFFHSLRQPWVSRQSVSNDPFRQNSPDVTVCGWLGSKHQLTLTIMALSQVETGSSLVLNPLDRILLLSARACCSGSGYKSCKEISNKRRVRLMIINPAVVACQFGSRVFCLRWMMFNLFSAWKWVLTVQCSFKNSLGYMLR